MNDRSRQSGLVPRGAAVAAVLFAACLAPRASASDEQDRLFRQEIAPIVQKRCLRCHQGKEPKGDVDLSRAEQVIDGRGDGWVVVPGKPDESRLIEVLSGPKPEMPKSGGPLAPKQVEALRRWVAAGAYWPDKLVLQEDRTSWWSLRPLARPDVPPLGAEDRKWCRNPIDAFVMARLRRERLAPAPEADRRTLVRRLYFDLVGLPPPSEEIDAFVADRDPAAYEKLVDRLLASPRYGERWGRHWLDVVHYGDTHGYDKDKLRPNAWPYRDYVIRALNEDKPYAEFVREQLAGDVLGPDSPEGTVALGFLAAGPFDYVGQIEVAEGTAEKKQVRNLDRDDMVATTMNTFVSLTAQCARCHDHKFDPISQKEYYSLQAVFAAVDRADRPYDADPKVAARRAELSRRIAQWTTRQSEIEAAARAKAGGELTALDRRLAELRQASSGEKPPEFGFHSQIEARQDVVKWVQVDLGEATPIAEIVLVGCHDDFGGIGAGFGFPVRYKVEVCDDQAFARGAVTVADATQSDAANPGVVPQRLAAGGRRARYVRVTATRLAPRTNDYIFALAELSVLTPEGRNAALNKPVTSLDSIEAPVRWARKNLVDGLYFGGGRPTDQAEIARLEGERRALLERALDAAAAREREDVEKALKESKDQLASLPRPSEVFAAATEFAPAGAFRPTGGKPRPIHVLARGNVLTPGEEVRPGTVSCLKGLPSHFDLGPDGAEGRGRAALARWITDPRNPLTWRSIVNRVWQYHFGRGIVDSPNDFGHMGAEPTHPELLDWLAVEFRDGGQSLKALHRLIVTSATYRQSCQHSAEFARIDGGNQFLWRANRRRLEAEAIRDAVLVCAGKLDERMGGPGFRDFGFKDDHSPHYKYEEHDPDDPASHRRSVYRFIVRSVPDPFMTALDCADPSAVVAKRNETLTALQALALLNNKFMVRMAEHFAERVEKAGPGPAEQIAAAYRIALGRAPTADESRTLVELARKHGMASACRVIFNTNEFVFVD